MAGIFEEIKVSEELKKVIEDLRLAYSKLGDRLELIGPSREKSLALTHLQTSSMYAVRAIAVSTLKQ